MDRIIGVGLLLTLASCASHSYFNSAGHRVFEAGDYLAAAKYYQESAKRGSANELLFELDAGMSFFNAGHFEKALPYFLRSVKIWERKDYMSVSEETGKLLLSENVKTYTGEDYERLLIHAFIALTYLGLGNLEEAQVEARRIDELLKIMRDKEKKNYSESAFARYLSALLWEASGEWDSARIDYEAAFEIDPRFPDLGRYLLKACRKSGHVERFQYWRKKLGRTASDDEKSPPSELVVFFTYGLSPVKVPQSDDATALPKLLRRNSSSPEVILRVGTQSFSKTETVLDIEELSQHFLNEKMKWLVSRKVISTALKAGAAVGVAKATKSEELGWLTFMALAMVDTTDLRSWTTLPAGIRMMRIPLEPGYRRIKLTFQRSHGTRSGERDFGERQFLPGKKHFLVLHEP